MLTYLSELEARVNALQKPQRILFACWATDRLIDRGLPFLQERIGAELADSLVMTLGELKESATAERDSSEQVLSYWRDLAARLDWPREGDGIEAEHADFLATELVEAFLQSFEVGISGSAEAAAHCAERLLNCIDFELQMLHGVIDPSEHRLFREELGNQTRKLEELEQAIPPS